jgi:hypothetical protein
MTRHVLHNSLCSIFSLQLIPLLSFRSFLFSPLMYRFLIFDFLFISTEEQDIDPKNILKLWESFVPHTQSFMSCDALSDVFANCLSDYVINSEKSYSASNIVISQFSNGVKEKDSIAVNSKNENTSAITSDNKGILGSSKGTFEGVDIRLLSRVLADDVANSFWNIQASSGQVSGSVDHIPSISFLLFALFPNLPVIFFFLTNI